MPIIAPAARSGKIQNLRDNRAFFRMEAMVNGLCIALRRERLPLSRSKLINSAADKMERIISGCKDAEVKNIWEQHVVGLRSIQKFIEQGHKPVAAAEAYSSFAPEWPPAEIPEKLNKKIDPTGNMRIAIELMFGADPEFASFAFSQFPYETSIKYHPLRLIRQGNMGRAYLLQNKFSVAYWRNFEGEKKIDKTDPKNMASPQNMCINSSHELEHLLFQRFLYRFFIYPIYTEASFPFCVDLTGKTESINKARGEIERMRLKASNVKPKKKKVFAVRTSEFFHELRANLKMAETAVKIGFHYYDIVSKTGWDSLPKHMDYYEWAESLTEGRSRAKIAEEMLSLAHLFQLTPLGEKYVEAENAFLNQVESDLKTAEKKRDSCKASWREGFRRAAKALKKP